VIVSFQRKVGGGISGGKIDSLQGVIMVQEPLGGVCFAYATRIAFTLNEGQMKKNHDAPSEKKRAQTERRSLFLFESSTING